MFWDDVVLVTEMVSKYGLQSPLVDLGGLANPCIADYELTIKSGIQSDRYVTLKNRPFDHIDLNYQILNPELGDLPIEQLPESREEWIGTAVCLSTMEHVGDPKAVFKAFGKLLKSGGLLIVSTVFSFPYHPSPEDNWRYSDTGLRILAKQAGLVVLESGFRLNIHGGSGVLDIHTSRPQEIQSSYVVACKEGLCLTAKQMYALPERFRDGVSV